MSDVELHSRMRHLRLSGMVESLPGRLQQATSGPLSHREFLELLVGAELARRGDRLFARRLKQAGIVEVKEFGDFDFHFNPKIPKAGLLDLGTARFVSTHDDVLLIGPPGTGKAQYGQGHRDRSHPCRLPRAPPKHLRPGPGLNRG